MAVDKWDEYINYAKWCIDQAERCEAKERVRLIEIAAAWIREAEATMVVTDAEATPKSAAAL